MNARSRRIRRAIGYAFIASVWAALLAVLAIFAVAYAVYADLKSPASSRLVAGTKFEGIAVALYNGYFRPIWQRHPRVRFDPALVYVPAPGRFRFHGPEFETWVTMTEEGTRQQPATAENAATRELVVVAGDSFAMGWGVNDAETFSAVLQERYHYRTINTAVSSYGTARELLRLRQLGLLSRASVVILQYCGNDAGENRAFLEHNQISSLRPRQMWEELNRGTQTELSYGRVLGGTFGLLRAHLMTELARRFSVTTTKAQVGPPASPRRAGRRAETAVTPAADFLAVLDRFPELQGKSIVVFEASVAREPGMLTDLAQLAAERTNLRVVTPRLEDADYFRFDGHFNVSGHAAVAAELDRALRALGENAPAASPE